MVVQHKDLHVGGIYRHFKGGYYLLERLCASDDLFYTVVYRRLGGDNMSYCQSEVSFIEDVSERKDNVTGQTKRFEFVPNFERENSLEKVRTELLVVELMKRADNPYAGIDLEHFKSRIIQEDYVLARCRDQVDPETQEEYVDIQVLDGDTSLEVMTRKFGKRVDKNARLLKRLYITGDFDPSLKEGL